MATPGVVDKGDVFVRDGIWIVLEASPSLEVLHIDGQASWGIKHEVPPGLERASVAPRIVTFQSNGSHGYLALVPGGVVVCPHARASAFLANEDLLAINHLLTADPTADPTADQTVDSTSLAKDKSEWPPQPSPVSPPPVPSISG
jgi:hypothetical protein